MYCSYEGSLFAGTVPVRCILFTSSVQVLPKKSPIFLSKIEEENVNLIKISPIKIVRIYISVNPLLHGGVILTSNLLFNLYHLN